MKGIERKIDKLGRVVLPISFRKRLNLTENSSVNISLDDDTIFITPTEKRCALCGSNSALHSDVQLCNTCIRRVKDI